MEQSLQGDARAYRRLLELLTAALRRVVRGRARMIGIDGEDIVQEVLLALHLKRATWANGTPVAPWVTAIARNKLIDAFRRRGQQIEVSLETVAESLRAGDEEEAERHYDLRHLLGKLNDRQRRVITAVSLEGYSAQEAAQRLRMTEVSVRVTLHRSLKTLAASFRTVPNED